MDPISDAGGQLRMAITQHFLEKRLRLIDDAFASGQSCELNLRMCNIGTLRYDLNSPEEWAQRLPRILKLNASVNDLSVVDRISVQPFPGLTHLDISVNAIKSISGLEVLRHLKVLNVSHNHLRTVDWMTSLRSVEEVDVSMNELESLVTMPSLIMLRSFFINDNKLRSLHGIQALPYLEKLEAQRNAIVDIFPLAASRQLKELNVSDNVIRSLENTASVLSGLPELRTLAFTGNPITEHPDYREDLMKMRRLVSLDGVPLPGHFSLRGDRRPVSPTDRRTAGGSLLDVWSKAGDHDEVLRKRREILHLKNQLASLQDELSDYDQQYKPSKRDTSRGVLKAQMYSSPSSALTWHSPPDRDIPSQQSQVDLASNRPSRRKADYTGITDTDEVLRFASKELSQK